MLSAAVRLGIVGSYEAQRLQHGCAPWLERVAGELRRASKPTDLAQTAPLIDLLQARARPAVFTAVPVLSVSAFAGS